MGLLGKGFRDFVSEQVKERQKALGEQTSRFSTGNNTKSFLTNTPWIRLASSVNLDSTVSDGVYGQLKKSSLFTNIDKFKDDGLAKEFVLFGGVTDSTGNKKYSGVNKPKTSNFGGAYGFGSWDKIFDTNGEGYKPMPGITSMDFSYKNDGALSQASVSIKAFSRAQFQIIDVLFQRPGYTVLLEYGHSVFIDNDGKTKYAGKDIPFQTDPFKELFNIQGNTQEVTHYSLASNIYNEKKKWSGNYEGAFMKITKFNWKYNKDGSYDITVNLVGIGDIISSLKTNVVSIDRLPITLKEGEDEDDANDQREDLKEAKSDGNFLLGNSQSTALNSSLYKEYEEILKKYENSSKSGNIFGFGKELFSTDLTINNFPSPKYDTEGFISGVDFGKNLKIKSGLFLIPSPDKENDVDDYDHAVYITFGGLVSILTTHVNLVTEKKIPQIFYDFNYEPSSGTEIELKNDKTYLSTYEGNISSAPQNILIPFQRLPDTILKGLEGDVKEDYKKLFNDKNLEIQDGLKKFNEQFFISGEKNKGRLDRVYLDLNYIAKVLDDNTNIGDDKLGECNLIDFLKSILGDINNSLGGINEFRVIFNQETQLIQFLSETPVTFENTSTLSTINTLGIEDKKGSFVKEIDLKAELNDDFATIISVGAQSDGNRLQGNAGAFSLYNKGLKDRIIPEKLDPQKGTGNTISTVSSDPLIKSVITEDFLEALENVYDDGEFEDEYLKIINQYLTSISPLIIGVLEKEKKYPTPFFLPFNLGLTLHGLGGIRIYDNFQVDGKMLPPSYDPDKISLIIKSLSHSVSLDGWVTKIETIPKPKFTPNP